MTKERTLFDGVLPVTSIAVADYLNGERTAEEMDRLDPDWETTVKPLYGPFYRDEVMDLSPVGYWRLGDASGDAVAEVGDNGTYIGGFTRGVDGAIVDDTDKAVQFNGSTGYVSVPDSASLDVGDVFSIVAWIKRATTGDQWFISKGNGSFGISLQTDHTVAFLRTGFVLLAHSSVTITADGNWHMVAVTKDGATRKVYVDGVDRTVTDSSGTCTNTTNALFIGRGNAASFWNGSVDEVAIWNRALSAAEILGLYETGSGT